MLWLIFAMACSGLVIGALGRLVVPGPNPMGIGQTILVGLAGSFAGGLIGRLVFGLRYRYAYGLSFVIAVLSTAIIVASLERHRRDR